MEAQKTYTYQGYKDTIYRFIKNLPVRIQFSRTEKAIALLELAQEICIREKSATTQLKGISKSGIVGTLAGATLSIGAFFGPLGFAISAIGGVIGATIGNIDSTTHNTNYRRKYIFKDVDWPSLLRTPAETLNTIIREVISSLYPQRFSKEEILMLCYLGEIAPNSLIDTVNCDLGTISEFERINSLICLCNDLTDFEQQIRQMMKSVQSFPSDSASIKLIMMEKIEYTYSHHTQSALRAYDWESIFHQVKELGINNSLVVVIPTNWLYYPNAQELRKRLFGLNQLKACMQLKKNHNGIKTKSYCALVFTGKKHDRILMLKSSWDDKLSFSCNYTKFKGQIGNVIDMINNPSKIKGWRFIESHKITVPYILSPNYYTLENNKKHTQYERLGNLVSHIRPTRSKNTLPTCLYLSYEQLSKEKPLKPIHKEFLDRIRLESSNQQWHKITTDNIIFLYILNNRIFSAYMENVKGESILLGTVPRNEILILGLNNHVSITPQYMAQIFQSYEGCVAQQLLAAEVYSKDLATAVLNIYLPVPNISSQYRAIAKTVQHQVDRTDSDWNQKFNSYYSSIRDRKHALSQEITSLQGETERLIKYCKNTNGKTLNLNHRVGLKPVSVETVIERIEKRLSEISNQISYLGDLDNNFGDAVQFNIIEQFLTEIESWETEDIDIIKEEDFSDLPTRELNIIFPIRGFQRILSNIYANARIHGFSPYADKPAHKNIIRISWFTEGDMVSLKIANNGKPLPETSDDFFNNAHREPTYRKGHVSAGIGNMESRQLIEQYGGTISLDRINEGKFKVAYTLNFKLIY